MIALALALLLQSPPAPAPTPASRGFEQTEVEYRVGVGDVLEVTVFGNAELSRIAPVQTSGTLAMPLLGDVSVSGLSVFEVQRKLTTLLERDYLVKPQVEVKIQVYQSQFVFVMGELNRPGRQALRGSTRLIDVLLEAGGFTPRASGEVLITRSEGTGEASTLRIRLSGSSPTPQDQINLRIPLRNGDVLNAVPQSYVTVEGEVNRPGRYVIEADLTVTGAVSLAGGLTRYGKQKIKLSRLEGDKRVTVPIDLKAIRDGKSSDLPVRANDTLTISRRLF